MKEKPEGGLDGLHSNRRGPWPQKCMTLTIKTFSACICSFDLPKYPIEASEHAFHVFKLLFFLHLRQSQFNPVQIRHISPADFVRQARNLLL